MRTMNQFWVDPNGLNKSGAGYTEVQQLLQNLQQQVGSFGNRYAASFGDDKEGLQFQQNFTDGYEQFLAGMKQMGESMGYIGNGLHFNGKDYQQSGEDAQLLSRR